MRKLLIMFPMILLMSGASSSGTMPKILAVCYLAPISYKVDSINRRTAELIPLKK